MALRIEPPNLEQESRDYSGGSQRKTAPGYLHMLELRKVLEDESPLLKLSESIPLQIPVIYR